jgi:hypothetical protein
MLPWVYYHENTRFYLRFYTNKTLLFIVKYEKNHALLTAFSRMALWATFGTGALIIIRVTYAPWTWFIALSF